MLPITKDILFDAVGGDIRFNYSDIVVLDDKEDILYQNVVHRVITNFGDLKLNTQTGADLSREIGKPITPDLLMVIKGKVINALTLDKFLKREEIEVIVVPNNDNILIRINVYTEGQSSFLRVPEKITINTVFNPLSGLIYADV